MNKQNEGLLHDLMLNAPDLFFEDARKITKSLLAAGYIKRPKGEWLYYLCVPFSLRCSACRRWQPKRYAKKCKFCPNCGAKMEGENHERSN